MRFTFWAVILPFALNGLELLLHSHDNPLPFGAGVSLLLAIWFWGGLPVTVLYWIVRLVRHAWRDGSARPSSRPAGWIYPNER